MKENEGDPKPPADASADQQRRALLKKAAALAGVVGLSALAGVEEANAVQRCRRDVHCGKMYCNPFSAKLKKQNQKTR